MTQIILTILVVIFMTLMSRFNKRHVSREIVEALSERDSLIQTLQSEITDKFTQCQTLVKQSENAAHAAQVQAAQCQLRASSAEGICQKFFNPDEDIIINMGEDGSLQVGRAILDLQNVRFQHRGELNRLFHSDKSQDTRCDHITVAVKHLLQLRVDDLVGYPHGEAADMRADLNAKLRSLDGRIPDNKAD